MTPEQLHDLKEDLKSVIQDKVNGKIDRIERKLDEHNVRHEAIVADILPIIKEYKDRQIRDAFLKEAGERIKWIAGVGTAIGIVWLFIKGLWKP